MSTQTGPTFGVPLGIEAARDDQLGKSAAQVCWERPTKDLNWQASACVPTTSDVSPHGAFEWRLHFATSPLAWLARGGCGFSGRSEQRHDKLQDDDDDDDSTQLRSTVQRCCERDPAC